MSPEAASVEALKTELRRLGWYVRYSEWPSGHQVVLHRRSDTSIHLVTDWHATELGAWTQALALARQHAPSEPPAQ